MNPEIISQTIQKFDGVSYYKCGHYFQRKGVRLHRVVWEYHNGAIPQGYHVHHIDHNSCNNRIENLMLMPEREHLSNHMRTPERTAKSRESIKKAIECATEWHSTAEGLAWHSSHAKSYWSSAPKHSYVCTWCGKEYETKAVRYSGNHFCCSNCKAAALRWRRKHEGQENYPCR
nr:MAG TPA: homing endonuclease [Caudoviricetes sp.]